MLLQRWTYSKEEWKNFIQWKRRKKGFLFALLRKLLPGSGTVSPEVRISTDRVWVNHDLQCFQDPEREFREIRIRDAGSLNILEIRYAQENQIRAIELPIPKGKLREAFEVQEKLKSGK